MKTKAAKQPKKSKRALKLKDIKPKPKTNPKGGQDTGTLRSWSITFPHR